MKDDLDSKYGAMGIKDLLISKREDVLRIAARHGTRNVRVCGGKGALNQHLFKITSTEYPMWFLYFWLKEHLPEFQLIAASKATTMDHIQRHHFSEAKAVIPTIELNKKTDSIIRPLSLLLIKNNLESKSISGIRDAMLSKLISGEIKAKVQPDSGMKI